MGIILSKSKKHCTGGVLGISTVKGAISICSVGALGISTVKGWDCVWILVPPLTLDCSMFLLFLLVSVACHFTMHKITMIYINTVSIRAQGRGNSQFVRKIPVRMQLITINVNTQTNGKNMTLLPQMIKQLMRLTTQE